MLPSGRSSKQDAYLLSGANLHLFAPRERLLAPHSAASNIARLRMTFFSAIDARANFYRLMDQVAQSHQPLFITGKRHDAVLVSADDWRVIQETLYLLAVPGVHESIKDGMVESLTGCAKELDW